ncbi:glycosyltransferase family 1 protein [Marinobacter sp. NP-4(2019)]|uniref:glycosyltransferase family 4 protein n=1 Tax=Marinobacter sp. NP-4(2019) TaxID=2488665 RepID=UPI000FC3DB3B|nr:glycosyltransferase family 4 protein [Marinobacter sp. NP-4(2019)]AZT84503.1 glycosyltransferase family 1 protein [Marinobacter sp. NP-4(2019)]
MKLLYAYRYGIVGGVSTQLLLRQDALEKAGHEASLFFSQDNGLGQLLGARSRIFFGSGVSFQKLVRQERFDAVVVIDSPELLKSASGSMLRKNPVYLDVHTTTDTGLSYLLDLDARQLDGVMVPTDYSSRLVGQRLGEAAKIQVVPNILNTEVFYPHVKASHFGGEPTSREFVWVGKLDNHKNWRLALVYAGMLKDLLGNIQLYVVGGYTAPPKQAEEFFELAFRLGISDSVSWLDRVENTTLASLYKRCALSGGAMLVTSRDESFGMAAAESLLCGCPLIANDLPVFREVFPSSPLVHLVDIWDPEQVARAAQNVEALANRESLVEQVYKQLGDRYGAGPFVKSFLNFLGGQ